jgi:uncharacterized protein YoxC
LEALGLKVMAAYVTREEFGILEREVEGEKLVTRHVLEQTRRNSDDLAVLKTRLERVESKVDSLQTSVDGLVRDLPKIVGEAVRTANSTRRGKR